MKKALLVLLVAVVAFAAFAGGAQETASASSAEPKVVIITDATGVDDKSFNAAAWRGILQFYNDGGKGQGSLYSNIKCQSSDDYLPNLKNAAAQGFDLIITTGFTFGDAVAEFSAQYPNQKIIIVDVDYLPQTENLIQYIYEEEQGSYLVGVVAAEQAKAEGIKNPKFGFIGGVPGATITKFEVGYIEGILSVLPDAEIVDYYANDWGAPQLAKTVAKQWYDSGVYCIFTAAGGTGSGAIDQAKEYRAAGKNVWVIGVDSDQYEDGIYAEGKSAVLTSMLKVVENSTIDALTKVKNNTFKGGVITQNMKTDGVGFSVANADLAADAKTSAEAAKKDILDGKMVVDKTYKQLAAKFTRFAGKLSAIDD